MQKLKKKLEVNLEELEKEEIIDSEEHKMLQEIKETYKTLPMFRSFFQQKYFVLNDIDFPTPDGKYWQARKEMWVHFEGLVLAYFSRKKEIAKQGFYSAKMRKLQEKLNKHPEGSPDYDILRAKIEYYNVKRNECEFKIRLIEKEIRERIREIKGWVKIIKELEPQLKYSKEDPEEHQKEFWNAKIEIEKKIREIYGVKDEYEAKKVYSAISGVEKSNKDLKDKKE